MSGPTGVGKRFDERKIWLWTAGQKFHDQKEDRQDPVESD